MIPSKASLVWPADPSDPGATTNLSVEELIEHGGAPGMRRYVAGRLAIAASADPNAPLAWSRFALEHAAECVGDTTDGGVTMSAAAVQMLLAYVAYLQSAQAGGSS
ncbi:hypothetical protein [Sphingomonas sp.]|jgi:hypothetical protein|uniref:hypothetical protein n=1 Tax=Sphingomonas sp. TaxID=28214 RepID=UPI002632063B|nr:hypothetical protein [Sphingomonas sp.]MDF2495064.1 hypothetical protein [Sphingomonas sp.]